jgi:signal transduction histidine kinase
LNIHDHVEKYNSENNLQEKLYSAFKLCDHYIEYDIMDSAQVWLSRAKVIGSQLPLSQYNYLLYTRQAEIFYYQHLYEFGIQASHNGFTIASKLNDSLLKSDAKFFEALFNFEIDSVKVAAGLLFQALQLYPKNPREIPGFALIQPFHILNNISECYVRMNLPDTALQYNKLASTTAYKNNMQRGICNTLFTYGEIYRAKKQYDSANIYYQKCLAFNKSTPYRDVDLLCTGRLLQISLVEKNTNAATGWYNLSESLVRDSNINISFKKNHYKFLSEGLQYNNYSGWFAKVDAQLKKIDSIVREKQQGAMIKALASNVENETEIYNLKEIQTKQFKTQRIYIGTIIMLIVITIAGLIWFRARKYYQGKIELERANLERQKAVEEERNRISRDMHDDLGSGLTKIAILSEVVKKHIHEPQKAKEDIDKIGTSSRELVDNLQDIIWILNPKNDTLENLTAYIREYGLKYFEPLGVKVDFIYPNEFSNLRLGEEQRRNTFLTIKESFNNIAKHAWCNCVTVTITESLQQVTITIADDGKGFDMTKVRMFANGLTNMKNRIEQSGGTYHITSTPGKGTITEIKMNI